MPKWSKDAKEFTVHVHYSNEKGTQVRVPKPILGLLGDPETLKFVIKGKHVEVEPGNATEDSSAKT
jgi:hypothetical protein